MNTTLPSLRENVGRLTTQVAALTGALEDLTASVHRLTASVLQLDSEVRTQRWRISEVMGWSLPMLIGLIMASAGVGIAAGMVIGIILKR